MRYIRVCWRHENPEYPIDLYSELDDHCWEVRKVELFADGRAGYAEASESFGSSALGEVPVPPLTEIASDPQFVPEEITRDEFESVWDAAHHAEHLR